VNHAVISHSGQLFMRMDNSTDSGFTSTPAISLHVSCATEAEIEGLSEKLAVGGQVFMLPCSGPFSPKLAWFPSDLAFHDN
jgi:predicted 3-demethylubiquinone-9 3-methyltransferase (glyoxalase superfamily)